MWRHFRIRVHQGKTQVWNWSGVRPPFCDVLDRAAAAAERDPTATAWRGDGLTDTQGIRVLGTPRGHDDFVRTFLQRTSEKHAILLERIPTAWALLLHCANARANYSIRVVRPELCGAFAEAHDSGLWRCLCAILEIPTRSRQVTSCLGGLGLRSAAGTRVAAHWASWEDSLPMIRDKHHAVAAYIVERLTEGSHVASLALVIDAASHLREFHGFDPPRWSELSNGARPPPRNPEDFEPGTSRQGWQHEAASQVERRHRKEHIMPPLPDHAKALLRSQSGRGRLRPVSTSANFFFDFGQFRLRPISTSANFDFGQFRLRPILACPFDHPKYHDEKKEKRKRKRNDKGGTVNTVRVCVDASPATKSVQPDWHGTCCASVGLARRFCCCHACCCTSRRVEVSYRRNGWRNDWDCSHVAIGCHC